ncbi:DUF2878 domain-containing protein (plasmid) [Pseudoalteromonas sp. T1lg65]|uniref:DUF2878 domain-containing protein n=1 Tax=Pseudoalteromonas sp. T1lg65 TaxID=2077101 RepID=UPI003F7B21D1
MTVLKHWITNALVFQLIWFSAFFLQSDALPIMIAGCAFMLWSHQNRRLNGLLMVLGAAIGITTEYLATQLGLLSYSGEQLIPLWLLVLWMALVLTINNALSRLLHLKAWVLIPLFAICAPPSYFAAAQNDILEVHVNWVQFWFMYGLLWAVSFYVITRLNRLLHGTRLAKRQPNC